MVSVHRILFSLQQVSKEPPFAAIIHRLGCDCDYSSVLATEMGCPISSQWNKGIPLLSLFSELKPEGMKQFQLNLAAPTSGGSASSLSDDHLMLKPMEIGAVKFHV